MTNITKNVIDIHTNSIIISCYTYRIINIGRITHFYHKTLKCIKSQNLKYSSKLTNIMRKKIFKITNMNYNIHKGKAQLFIIT